DVPAGPAAPPRRVPPRVLALLVRLPEGEVPRVLFQLAPLFFLGRVSHRILVAVPAREPPIVGEARDAEVDVARYRVCMTAFDELLDQRDDLGDRLRRLRLVVGPAEAEILRVLDVPAARVGGQLPAVPGRGGIDLVVDIRDVL